MAAVADLPQGDVEENPSDNASRILPPGFDCETLAPASPLTPCSVKCCLFSFLMCCVYLSPVQLKPRVGDTCASVPMHTETSF